MGGGQGGVRVRAAEPLDPVDVRDRPHRHDLRDAASAVHVPRYLAVHRGRRWWASCSPRRPWGVRGASPPAGRKRPPSGVGGHLGGGRLGRGDHRVRPGRREPRARPVLPGARGRRRRHLAIFRNTSRRWRPRTVCGQDVPDLHPGGDRRSTPGRLRGRSGGDVVHPDDLGGVGRDRVLVGAASSRSSTRSCGTIASTTPPAYSSAHGRTPRLDVADAVGWWSSGCWRDRTCTSPGRRSSSRSRSPVGSRVRGTPADGRRQAGRARGRESRTTAQRTTTPRGGAGGRLPHPSDRGGRGARRLAVRAPPGPERDQIVVAFPGAGAPPPRRSRTRSPRG